MHEGGVGGWRLGGLAACRAGLDSVYRLREHIIMRKLLIAIPICVVSMPLSGLWIYLQPLLVQPVEAHAFNMWAGTVFQ